MTEAGVDHHSHPIGGVFGHEGRNRFIELFQTWCRPALSRDVRTIDDDVSGHVACQSTTHTAANLPSAAGRTLPDAGCHRRPIDPTDEVTDLLQHLIRNACVNDGSVESGQEQRSADTLTSYLEGSGVDIERYEPEPGRTSVVARIEGSDPEAPTLLLMGHTDVVPVNEDRWQRDPFGGELVDGVVWGRGAVDMLNLTASMAVATKRLATSGFTPKGTLIYLGVADEEALGTWGAGHLAEHELDAVKADYVITESGGIPLPGPDGLKLPVIVGEKGSNWVKLRVTGTPGHGSQPYKTDNALVTAAQVVQRIADFHPPTQIHDVWRQFLEGMGYPDELVAPLLSEDGFMDAVRGAPARHGPPVPRLHPHHVRPHHRPRRHQGERHPRHRRPARWTSARCPARPWTTCGRCSTRRWAIWPTRWRSTSRPRTARRPRPPTPRCGTRSARMGEHFYAGSAIVPFLTVGATDARFFRREGIPSYGFGMFSEKMSFEDYGIMFHGDDERIDVDSLRLSTQMWEALAHDLLG